MPSIKELEKLPKWTSNLYIIGLGHQDPNKPNNVWMLPTTANHSLNGYNSYRRWSPISDFIGSIPAHHFSVSSSYYPEVDLLKEASRMFPEYECAIASVSSMDTGGSSDTFVQFVKNGAELEKTIFNDFSNPRIALLLSYKEKTTFEEWIEIVQKWWKFETSPEGEYNSMYLKYHEQILGNDPKNDESTNFIKPFQSIVSSIMKNKESLKNIENLQEIFEILLYSDVLNKQFKNGNIIEIIKEISKTEGKELFCVLDNDSFKTLPHLQQSASLIQNYFKNNESIQEEMDLKQILDHPFNF